MFQPFQDVVMDVFIHDSVHDTALGQLVEFNSFGAWGNASSGSFHWLEDEYDLKQNTVISIRQ